MNYKGVCRTTLAKQGMLKIDKLGLPNLQNQPVKGKDGVTLKGYQVVNTSTPHGNKSPLFPLANATNCCVLG